MAQPRYAPNFRIKINDQLIPAAVRASVTSVRYEDGINAADRVEISLANIDLRWLQNHIRGLGFQPFPTAVKIGPVGTAAAAPAGTFDLDNNLSLAMGYAPDPLVEMFRGEITGLSVSFPSSGPPTLTLVAHDYLNRLSQGKYARGFGLLPDFLIAAILSAENLLIPLIDPAIVASSTALAAINVIFSGTGRKQKAQSDLEVLQEIATAYDADFWVDGDTLYLARFAKEKTPSLTLSWGKSLIEFSPRVSTVGQVAGVAAKFTLREIPLDFLVTVSWDFDRETLGVTIVPGIAAAGKAKPKTQSKSGNGAVFTIVDQPISSPGDLAASSLGILRELRRRLNNRLTGSGAAIGDPHLRAGAMIRLEGLGPDFSGDYRVTSATHTIDGGGYRTSFEVRKEIIP
jgi:phage protein D